MKIVFFNHWHNGDIHAARGIIRQIIKKVKQIDPLTEFIYSHKNSPDLLSDIDNLKYDESLLNNISHQSGISVLENTVYINTWYDQQNQKYARQYGILTIDAIFAALNEACQKLWQFSLEELSYDMKDFFPIIDYEKFSISQAKQWLENNISEKILVENGLANSNQAHNFDFNPIIHRLAQENLNKVFILTSKQNYLFPSNVFYSSDIIGKKGTDLNEISFISTYCNTIIGRASGVFTFTLTKNNLFERDIKYLCFSHLTVPQHKFWLGSLFYNKTNYRSIILNSASSNTEEIYNIIKRNL